MKRIALTAAVLLWATLAHAQSVTLPATIEGEVGDFVTIEAKTDDAIVKWKTLDSGLKLFPVSLLKDTKTAIVIAAQPGRYRLLAVSAKDGIPSDFSECVVIIGGAPLPPPVVPPGPGPVDPPLDPGKPTSATYIYEKDNGGVPPPVSAALSKLNATGLRATTFEEDTVDGSGDVPEQYRVPLEAAQKAGLPALVVMAGQNVKRVVKAPTTEAQVTEAVQPLARDGEVQAPVADETSIPPLRSVLAALNCGCQSGNRCTCHKGGAHCDCAANMAKAKRLYPKAIVKPKKPATRRVASR